MKLEAGKYYRNRKWEVMGPIRPACDKDGIPWQAPKASGEGPTVFWYRDGTHMSDGSESPEDLIAEVKGYPIIVENVNHPAHYNESSIECIDAIEAALTPEEFRGFCKGNALKYIWREKHKGGNEDLKKAAWYLNELIQ